jgi:Flp pilus assembly protein TadB
MSAVNWSLALGLVAIFAAVFLVAVTVLGALGRAGEQRDLAGRIGQYGPRHGASQRKDDVSGDKGTVHSVAVDVTKRLISPAAQQRLAGRLELAGVARKPAEWVLLGGCAGVVVAAAVAIPTSNVYIGLLAGAVVGALSPWLLLNFLIHRRRSAFADQLPDLLQLLASSLLSGFSLLQALDAAVREASQPAAGEFARALAEARIGADLEDCMDTIADRMGSDDLKWTVMAIRIQRGIGGNLAEVLSTTVSTIRERGFLRRHVQALSAEGRLSAYVLVALPLVAGAYLFVTSPSYMRPLYTTGIGQFMLAGAFVLVVIGAVIMRQMIKVEY